MNGVKLLYFSWDGFIAVVFFFVGKTETSLGPDAGTGLRFVYLFPFCFFLYVGPS